MTTGSHAVGRYRSHELIAAELGRASDEELLALLPGAELAQVGHATVRLPHLPHLPHLPGGARTVFVKLVPIAALELVSHNRGTTANIFGLPAYYQYRIGTCGLGAWRELEVHRLANEWVRSEQCVGFPLLHHGRVLPVVKTGYDDRRGVELWGDCPEIHQRVAAIHAATSSLVLFLEYFPLTLSQWFRDLMRRASDPVRVVSELEGKLRERLAFIHARGLIHLDAHFDNLITDGNELCLTDFGLSVSRGFELGADEQAFFEAHQNFDLCTAVNALVHAVVTFYDARSDWRQTLREMTAGARGDLDAAPEGVRSYLVQRAPLALAVGKLYDRLLEDPTAAYPTAELDALLAVVAK